MTVKDLIAKLQEFPPDLPVLIFDGESWGELKTVEGETFYKGKYGVDTDPDPRRPNRFEGVVVA